MAKLYHSRSEPTRTDRDRAGGPDDGAPTVSPGAGTAIAGVCLLAAAAIVGYGLWIVVA